MGGRRGFGRCMVVSAREGGSWIEVFAVMLEVAGAFGRGWNLDIAKLDLEADFDKLHLMATVIEYKYIVVCGMYGVVVTALGHLTPR